MFKVTLRRSAWKLCDYIWSFYRYNFQMKLKMKNYDFHQQNVSLDIILQSFSSDVFSRWLLREYIQQSKTCTINAFRNGLLGLIHLRDCFDVNSFAKKLCKITTAIWNLTYETIILSAGWSYCTEYYSHAEKFLLYLFKFSLPSLF